MSENGKLYIKRTWLLVIIFATVVATTIAIALAITAGKAEIQNKKNEVNVINEVTELTKPDYTLLDEGAADVELPKIEKNTLATANSTINGKIPSFYNPVIPKGFKAIGSEQDKTIDENAKWGEENAYLYGLVIEDANGNQFVWIPVENMKLFKRTDWQKNVPSEKVSEIYVEPEENNIAEEAYQKMYYKVKKYGGFYIGRYETGDASSEGERAAVKNSSEVAIKKYLNSYNYVPFKQTTIEGRDITGAELIAKNFGIKNNYSTVVTSVTYGVQWDAMLRFVVSDTNNVNDSINWGNYSVSELFFKNVRGEEFKKEKGEIRLLRTGASEATKAKNIYDVAGNLYEWTMETSGSGIRVVRGGCYVINLAQLAAARYAYKDTTANNAIGFRISFYIN